MRIRKGVISEMKERLEKILEDRNMRPSSLAKAAGLSTSTVDDIIKGKTNELNIGVNKMLKIANALGVSVESLYGRDEPAGPNELPDQTEQQLIDLFRMLNSEGKEKALDYLSDLVDMVKYKKTQ